MSRRHRLKSVGAIVVAAALAAGIVAGCGGSDDDSTSAADTSGSTDNQSGSGVRIGLVSALDCSNAVVCEVQEAFTAQAEAMGAEPVVLEADVNNLIDNQISNFDQLRVEGVDAIAVWPQDESALAAPIKRAVDAGIPVFAHEAYEPEKNGIVTDVLEGRKLTGLQAAEQTCDRAPDDGGQVLYGDFALPNPGLAILLGQFEETLGECDKDVEIVKFLNKTDDVAGARPTAEAAFQKAPDAFAVTAYNDPTAAGASLAAEQLGNRDDLFIMGYNLGPDGVKALETERIDMSWDYRSAVVGQTLAKVMTEYANGEQKSPPKIITVWPKCYTPDTVGDRLTPEENVQEIEGGTILAEADPDLIEESAAPVDPSNSLPGCSA